MDEQDFTDRLLNDADGALRAISMPAAQRERVLESTLTVVRRYRWRRRATAIGGAAAAYAAGLATVLAWSAAGPHAQAVAPGEQAPRVASQEDVQAPAPVPSTAVVSGAHLERQAAYAPLEERPELLRRAGDAYLTQDDNLGRALRCYRLFMAAADAPDLVPRQTDTWLLLTLKTARQNDKADTIVPAVLNGTPTASKGDES